MDVQTGEDSFKISGFKVLYRNSQLYHGKHCLHFINVGNDLGKKVELEELVVTLQFSACFVL